ncbi:MAG: DUF4244 domain-containing protein [Actinocrinis sp.]
MSTTLRLHAIRPDSMRPDSIRIHPRGFADPVNLGGRMSRYLARRQFKLVARSASRYGPQAGTTTAEYAIGTLAACGFAALLYKIVTGGAVASLLSGIIHKALGTV